MCMQPFAEGTHEPEPIKSGVFVSSRWGLLVASLLDGEAALENLSGLEFHDPKWLLPFAPLLYRLQCRVYSPVMAIQLQQKQTCTQKPTFVTGLWMGACPYLSCCEPKQQYLASGIYMKGSS